jgi:hypothetical protein
MPPPPVRAFSSVSGFDPAVFGSVCSVILDIVLEDSLSIVGSVIVANCDARFDKYLWGSLGCSLRSPGLSLNGVISERSTVPDELIR